MHSPPDRRKAAPVDPEALQKLLAARGQIVCMLDGDGQNPPSEPPKLLAPLLAEDAPADLRLIAGQRGKRQDTAAERVVAFYDHRGTAEQNIKEDKNAIKWTRLSCRKFRNNEVRLQLHALAYNLGNLMRTLALPKEVERWSLTTLREKLVKIGAKVVSHGRYVAFQMAEVAVPRMLFAEILRPIAQLRPPPDPAPA